ncbi:PoNe immunity protein domain-containing protein [Aquabacterium sp.]|uniref:PoNe immunity protein domain-containing protein n=1 Tax=Aquabacterium sp. TaxID=1872578 RepID=UPI00378325D7
MTLDTYRLNENWARKSIATLRAAIPVHQSEGSLNPIGQRGIFVDLLDLTRLRFTAGETAEEVSETFDGAFAWLCKWHSDYLPYYMQVASEFPVGSNVPETDLAPTPLDLEYLEDFHRIITVLSIAILLGKGESIRIAADLLRSVRGTDMLVEELLSPVLQPFISREFFHVEPYDPLIDAYYTARSKEESVTYLERFLKSWYPAMKACAWHDSHLVQKGFRDHMVYPKDLVDWARQNDSLGKLRAAAKVGSKERGPRCEGGQPCPREGLWFSPAQPDSGRRFKQGEQMPVLGGAWGLTIWQWEADR